MKRVGLANGVFDLFHPGHAHFLCAARDLCDYLIVGVNSDRSVKRLKGDSRPFDSLHYRMDRVTHYADQVLPFDGNVLDLLALSTPHVLIRGWDQHMHEYGHAPIFIQLPRFGAVSTTVLSNYERQKRSGDPRLG